MFVGRTRELAKLDELYNSDKFQCVVIYGRRRVGKTTLINEFIRGKEAIYYTGIESNSKENLEAMSNSIFYMSKDFASANASFPSFQKAFETVFEMARDKRIIFVIDEYPYLADSSKSVSSILQGLIDKYHEDSKLYLILCGSSLSFMEYQVLGYKSPLYGRRTAQFRIKPLDFAEMKEYYSSFTNEELAVIYGITSGIPQYMSKIDQQLSLEQNIRDNFFTPDAHLFEEPTNLVKQECREPAQYNAIIKSIATGSSRLSEIATKIGVDTSLCSNYLTTLMSIGIVKKEFPFREERSKKTIYTIDDSMFRFWYRFVPDNLSLIQNNLPDLVMQRVSTQLSAFMGGVYEELCKQWLWQENIAGRLPIQFVDLGRWWGNDPIRKLETEIDIIAHADDDNAIFAECKWTNEKVDTSVLDLLVQRSELFKYKRRFLYLFSKSGFTEGCEEKAKLLGNVSLVSFDTQYSGK